MCRCPDLGSVSLLVYPASDQLRAPRPTPMFTFASKWSWFPSLPDPTSSYWTTRSQVARDTEGDHDICPQNIVLRIATPSPDPTLVLTLFCEWRKERTDWRSASGGSHSSCEVHNRCPDCHLQFGGSFMWKTAHWQCSGISTPMKDAMECMGRANSASTYSQAMSKHPIHQPWLQEKVWARCSKSGTNYKRHRAIPSCHNLR